MACTSTLSKPLHSTPCRQVRIPPPSRSISMTTSRNSARRQLCFGPIRQQSISDNSNSRLSLMHYFRPKFLPLSRNCEKPVRSRTSLAGGAATRTLLANRGQIKARSPKYPPSAPYHSISTLPIPLRFSPIRHHHPKTSPHLARNRRDPPRQTLRLQIPSDAVLTIVAVTTYHRAGEERYLPPLRLPQLLPSLARRLTARMSPAQALERVYTLPSLAK